MRLSSIVSEALRNIAQGTSRAVLLALAVFVCSGLLGGYEMASVLALEKQAANRIQADADVKVIVGAPIDGAACDNLAISTWKQTNGSSSANGPSISGALRDGPQITPTSTPGRDVTSYEATPGLLHLLAEHATTTGRRNVDKANFVSVDATGIWVPTDLANDFGLSVGSRFETTSGITTVAGIYQWPNDGRDTRLAYAVITPVSASNGTFDECWARQWPVSNDTDRLLYSTAIITDGTEQGAAGITQLNKGFDSQYDALGSYLTRMTRWMPALGLMIGVLLGVLSVHRRRLEYAGALHSGQTKGAQLLELAVETWIWAGIGTLCAIIILFAAGYRLSIADSMAITITAIRTSVALFSGTTVAAICAGACIRESQLFRYFKKR
ncbi:hypothetical protein JS532_08230 [Bifidobacterium callimiconis]|uniref:hypothetical protein n=1 Tax=Bifidobacterium callimiconis TaxID=2306973 RepID=UPI001BDC98C2|nr:hypothetical protein [Bifidobacterium callimiconis]MBT1177546.1 hypothetical protein [Bifidobacterium callimiconis]